ncbi:SCP2 sterol-binding domain-containing protein [Hydrogenothermus marinus]|uniref:Putative sterol carrier protein n=1 Tax=Hydrogenothermus marinus TaxID=133270 RepID=A0A3M0BFR4_9AQUI|nr:SCP2 sterol-binding domain-containing protein [Hydrogenothermus marinus]RMA96160.1 putative sterol carrier protein [Hydrogenothermus marinus]
MKKTALSIGFSLIATASFSFAQPAFMSPEYAKEFCDLWNKTPELTEGLAKWAKNIKEGKEYRSIQFYRSDCGGPEKAVEVHIIPKDGKAICVYGGKAVDPNPDFQMYATDENWNSLARGEFGFMGMGIMSKMTFKGSKWEAMQNMGPFKAFLLNLGKVPHTNQCP